MGRKKAKEEAGGVALAAKEDVKKAESDPTHDPVTQEGREARARLNQKEGYDAKHVEAQLEKHLEPIKARFRDQYKDHLASAGHPLKNQPVPGGGSMGKCVHCDNPTAMGQNYLCLDHIRVG